MKQKRDWPVFLTVCLALGSLGMVGLVCGYVGFGLHSPESKMAIYVMLSLVLVNVTVIRLREARLRRREGAPAFSRGMRRYSLAVSWLWRLGAALLLASLGMILGGFDLVHFWVRLLCLLGMILMPLGWLGILTVYHRRCLALQVARAEQKP